MSFQQDNFAEIIGAVNGKLNRPRNTPMKPIDIAENVEAIQTGETPTPTPTTGDFRIRYHYRDTVTGDEKIHTQRLNRGEDGVPPINVGNVQQTPRNPALTFQGWNYTQEQLNNVQGDIDVGAIYITADGKTYFNIRITRTTGASEADALLQTIYLYKNDTSTLSLDWGDGTAIEEITATGNFNRPHTYAQIGDYWVTAWISLGTGIFRFGNGSSTTTVFGGENTVKRNILRKVFVGNNVNLGNYAFNSCKSLISITMGLNITTLGTYCFQSCLSLTHITIPSDIIRLPTFIFSSCTSLVFVSLPNDIYNVGIKAFIDCDSLNSIIIPILNDNIEQNAFYGVSILIEIILHPKNPPILGSGVFQGISSITRIFVPDESINLYKTATNWVMYASFIFPMSERGAI